MENKTPRHVKIALGVLASLAGGVIFAAAGQLGAFGSRGIKDELSFPYHGKTAVLKREDKRFAPNDDYWVEIDGRDRIYHGNLTTDDGRYVEINAGGEGKPQWSIRDKKE